MHGFRLCFFHPQIRRLCLWPWVVGGICYLLGLVAVFYLHAPLLNLLAPVKAGIISSILQWGASLLVWILLFLGVSALSLIVSLVFTGVFQEEIAAAVLRENGISVPQAADIRQFLKAMAASVAAQSVKLLWLLPLLAFVFLVGLIPLLTPIALLFGSWVIAYGFLDVVFEVLRVRSGRRFRFAHRYFRALIVFGLTLSICFAIPFIGLFLTPVAVAGAAWMVRDPKLVLQLQQGN